MSILPGTVRNAKIKEYLAGKRYNTQAEEVENGTVEPEVDHWYVTYERYVLSKEDGSYWSRTSEYFSNKKDAKAKIESLLKSIEV